MIKQFIKNIYKDIHQSMLRPSGSEIMSKELMESELRIRRSLSIYLSIHL